MKKTTVMYFGTFDHDETFFTYYKHIRNASVNQKKMFQKCISKQL